MHPPTSPGWTDFTIMVECTPGSGHCLSVCILWVPHSPGSEWGATYLLALIGGPTGCREPEKQLAGNSKRSLYLLYVYRIKCHVCELIKGIVFLKVFSVQDRDFLSRW